MDDLSDTPKSIAIVGGGLAGLSLSILCATSGLKTTLFEKGSYPSHKVCGEYISMESWNFLTKALGLDLEALHLPKISKLVVTSHTGNTLEAGLPLGGFGISRYLIDHLLYQRAQQVGVEVHTDCTIQQISYHEGVYTLKDHNNSIYTSACCISGHGKRANLDQVLQRNFFMHGRERHNFVAVKYHVKSYQPQDTIALHNFTDGYCGFSKIEGDLYCLCYITRAAQLKKHGSIIALEKNVLYKNPHLKKIFEESLFVYEKPLTISQINFSKKELLTQDVLFVGDAAGLIQPLCGNGMSMAMHSSYLLHKLLVSNNLSNIKILYPKLWNITFARRLFVGRILSGLFGEKTSTELAIGLLKKLPIITRFLIRQTHGKEIIS